MGCMAVLLGVFAVNSSAMTTNTRELLDSNFNSTHLATLDEGLAKAANDMRNMFYKTWVSAGCIGGGCMDVNTCQIEYHSNHAAGIKFQPEESLKCNSGQEYFENWYRSLVKSYPSFPDGNNQDDLEFTSCFRNATTEIREMNQAEVFGPGAARAYPETDLASVWCRSRHTIAELVNTYSWWITFAAWTMFLLSSITAFGTFYLLCRGLSDPKRDN